MTSHRATLLLLCCTGCWSESHSTECSEPVYTELADDEASPSGITANSLLAIATRGWEGSADHYGSEVDLTFAVQRGDGPALFAETEKIDVVTRTFHLGGGEGGDLMMPPTCEDWVEVPAHIDLVSEEADIDLAMDATIRSPNELDSGADIEASVPYEQSGLVVESIEDESYEQESVEVSISMLPAEQSRGALQWIGTDPDYGRMVPILTWGGE